MFSMAAVNNGGPTMTAGRFPGKIGRRVADRIAGWPSRPGTAAKTPDVLVLLFDDVGFADQQQ